jgi:hypothetical protein
LILKKPKDKIIYKNENKKEMGTWLSGDPYLACMSPRLDTLAPPKKKKHLSRKSAPIKVT